MKLLPRLILFFAPLTLSILAASTYLTKRDVHQNLYEEVERRGLSLAETGAIAVAPEVARNNETAILPHLQHLKEMSGGSYAVILDPTGIVLAHTNIADKGKRYADNPESWTTRSDGARFREIETDRGPELEISVPVMAPAESSGEEFLLSGDRPTQDRPLGTLRLALPLASTNQVQNRIFMGDVILLSVAVLVSSFALILFLLRSVIWPTRRLLNGIAHISEGRYGEVIPVNSNDELGHLTNSFNKMSEVLASTTVSKDYMDAILLHMVDPLFVLTTDGLISSDNAATQRLLGYAEGELTRQPASRLFPADRYPFSESRVKALIEGSVMQDMELAFISKKGTEIPILFSASALRDKEQNVIGIIGVARDMTERKKLEARMLQSDKLSAVGQLAAGVAHEINNPLGIILGFAQSIKSQMPADDPSAMGLDFIEKETIRCKDLVQNLLMFSRSSHTEQREEVDIQRAIEDALSLVNAQSRVKNVELVKELSPDLPRVMANRNQIQQIIINLCNNAMDAMPDKGTLTIRSLAESRNGSPWVAIQVKDTGTGIPKELQTRIFEPFFTTKEVGKGTGLGLSLIYEIVQKHHGQIELDSELGKGTTFTIHLPIAVVETKVA